MLLCTVLKIFKAVFQNKLHVTLQMLIVKSQRFVPPITSVLIPKTFTSINNMMPLKTVSTLAEFIPN